MGRIALLLLPGFLGTLGCGSQQKPYSPTPEKLAEEVRLHREFCERVQWEVVASTESPSCEILNMWTVEIPKISHQEKAARFLAAFERRILSADPAKRWCGYLAIEYELIWTGEFHYCPPLIPSWYKHSFGSNLVLQERLRDDLFGDSVSFRAGALFTARRFGVDVSYADRVWEFGPPTRFKSLHQTIQAWFLWLWASNQAIDLGERLEVLGRIARGQLRSTYFGVVAGHYQGWLREIGIIEDQDWSTINQPDRKLAQSPFFTLSLIKEYYGESPP